MGAVWLRALAARPNLQVAGLFDTQREAAERLQREYAPAALIENDLARFLLRTHPDLVLNCTVPDAHFQVTLAALQAGAHVLSEKPLATSLAEAATLIAEARSRELTFAVMQNYRYGRGIRTVRKLLETGAIGRLTGVNVDFFVGAHFGGFRDRMEHVLLLDMSIHHFDMIRFLSGRDPLSVMAREWNPPGSWYRQDASAIAHFELTGEVAASYRGSWCAEGFRTSWNGQWHLTGTEGSLRWDGEGAIAVDRMTETDGFLRESKTVIHAVEEFQGLGDSHASAIGHFLDCLENGQTPETAAADNVKSLSMVLGAIESSTSARTVTIT